MNVSTQSFNRYHVLVFFQLNSNFTNSDNSYDIPKQNYHIYKNLFPQQRLTRYSYTGLIQQRTRPAKVHETESEAGGKESALGTLGREKNKGPPFFYQNDCRANTTAKGNLS